jgi:hypothetical protein
MNRRDVRPRTQVFLTIYWAVLLARRVCRSREFDATPRLSTNGYRTKLHSVARRHRQTAQLRATMQCSFWPGVWRA